MPATASRRSIVFHFRRNVMSFPAPRLLSLSAVILLTTSVALAQHDSGGVTGGGMIGGSTSTSRPTTKPTTKPTSTTTTAPRRKPTTPPVKRPTTTSTTTADSYYQQGEALYNQKKYREALDLYLKAT